MGFVLSSEGVTVDLTDMGIQDFRETDPLRTAELSLTDGQWSLQQRGALAPRWMFEGNFRPYEEMPGGTGKAEFAVLKANKTAAWTLSEVQRTADGTESSEAIGTGYIDGAIERYSEGMRDGQPLKVNWRFHLKLNPPEATPAPDPARVGEDPTAQDDGLGILGDNG